MNNEREQKKEHPDVETPRPPQVMDPSRPLEAQEGTPEKNPAKGGSKKKSKTEKTEKPKLLGESPLEIDDETTI